MPRKQKLHVNDLMEHAAPTEISSVDETWLVKTKEPTLYWVLNELLTNIHLSIT